MKFQIMLSYALLASLLMCCCLGLADDKSSGKRKDTERKDPEKMLNSTTTTHNVTTHNTTSESNMTIPIIILVEEEDDNIMQAQYDTDYAAVDVNWIVVRKITNITLVKESSVDPKTKKTTDVVIENRAEEYRMLTDDRQRQVLTEKDIERLPIPMRFR